MTFDGIPQRRAVAKPDCAHCAGSGLVVPISTPGFTPSWWYRAVDRDPATRELHCTDYGGRRLGGKYLCGLPHDSGNDAVLFGTPRQGCETCRARLEAGETKPVGGLSAVRCECVRYFVLNAVCWGWFCPNTSLCGVFNSDEKETALACRTCGAERPLADLSGRPLEKQAMKGPPK